MTKIQAASYPLSNILFVDDQVGWIVAGDQILKTTDGGTNWNVLNTNLTEPHTQISNLWFADRLRGWAAGELNRQATIWQTSDGGSSWTVVYSLPLAEPKALTPGVMVGIRFVDQLHGWAVGANQANAIIVATADGGQHWKTQYSGSEITGQLNVVRFRDSTNGWVLGPDAVMQTTDGGESWNLRYFGLGTLTDIDVAGPADVWVAGTWGYLLHSSDGVSWSKVKSANVSADQFLGYVRFVNKNLGWAAGPKGEIVMTRDGGKTWERDDGPLDGKALSEITLDAIVSTPSRLFVIANPGYLWVRPIK